jgi:DHA3 family macrolide efflux protein-like MFS transporter
MPPTTELPNGALSAMRKFYLLCAGLLVSVVGSSFTDVALSVWVYRNTGSVTQFGVSLIMSFLPGILFSPLAGALVDRWNRRYLLMGVSTASAVNILILALVANADALQLWYVYLAVGISSVLRAASAPAMNSIIVLLAPPEKVGQANGMVMLSQAIGGVAGFAVGGVLLQAVGISTVLLIDCATFLVNLAVLAFVRIPAPPKTTSEGSDGRIGGDIRQGWSYLRRRPELVATIRYYGFLTCAVGVVDALFTPLVLSFTNSTGLGFVLSCLGIGMALGSIALGSWGGPRKRVNGLAGFALPLGVFLLLGSLQPSVPLMMVAALGTMFCFTIVDGTTRAVIQLNVDPDIQGRVFSVLVMVSNAALCLAYAIAGPIADHVFEPLLRPGGALVESVGRVLGVGNGRGIAFMVLLLAIVVLIIAGFGYTGPALRSLSDRPMRKPAATPDKTAAPDQSAASDEAVAPASTDSVPATAAEATAGDPVGRR